MKKSTAWWLALLVTISFASVELCVVARWKTGVFDPRCLLLKGYVLAHRYEKGQPEQIRCLPDTP